MIDSTLSHLRALVVDDKATSVHRLSQLLERFDCDLTPCEGESQCVELAKATHPQLIMLSTSMAEIDPEAVAGRLRSSGLPPFLLVAINPDSGGSTQDRCKTLGFDKQLSTAATIGEVRDMIRAASQQASMPMPHESHYILKCTPSTNGINAAIEVDGIAHEAWSVQNATDDQVRELLSRAEEKFGGIEIGTSCKKFFPESA